MNEVKKYYKLTVEDENHHGFVYQDGLNVDHLPFNKSDSCCAGGLYFSDADNIMDFLDNHRWIREITIPEGELKFVKDPSINPPKWRSHSVICCPRRDLREVSTWEWMGSEGIVIDDHIDGLFSYVIYFGYVDILKYLHSLETINFSQFKYDSMLRSIVRNGDIEFVRYLCSLDNVRFSDSAYDNALSHSRIHNELQIESILKELDNSKLYKM